MIGSSAYFCFMIHAKWLQKITYTIFGMHVTTWTEWEEWEHSRAFVFKESTMLSCAECLGSTHLKSKGYDCWQFGSCEQLRGTWNSLAWSSQKTVHTDGYHCFTHAKVENLVRSETANQYAITSISWWLYTLVYICLFVQKIFCLTFWANQCDRLQWMLRYFSFTNHCDVP